MKEVLRPVEQPASSTHQMLIHNLSFNEKGSRQVTGAHETRHRHSKWQGSLFPSQSSKKKKIYSKFSAGHGAAQVSGFSHQPVPSQQSTTWDMSGPLVESGQGELTSKTSCMQT